MTTPQILKVTISHGLLSFPLTDFDGQLEGHGYAVSLVKAGATLVGHSAGPVRPPLSELKPAELDQLGQLISKLGAQ